ncbi:MAG: glycosyltransferase family protein [Candidatus Thermoplasmatota archaeon]
MRNAFGEFFHDFASAKAVMVNGEFSTIREALYLKKPIFCFPIQHQFEQAFNAKCIEQMGVGVSHAKFCENDLKDFLDHLRSFQEPFQRYTPGN